MARKFEPVFFGLWYADKIANAVMGDQPKSANVIQKVMSKVQTFSSQNDAAVFFDKLFNVAGRDHDSETFGTN